MKRMTLAAGVLASGFLAGCTVGPNYHRPAMPAPPAYKSEGPWRVAAPKDAIPKGAWWEVYNDAELNGYEKQLLAANQSLSAAKDRLSQARALARVASAGYFPDGQYRSQRLAQQVFRQSSGSRNPRQAAHPKHI